jgi:5-formyltetrahydrofolate cyclo-ligase
LKDLSSWDKRAIREYVWNKMMETDVARFPLPPHNRIPNFHGAEDASRRILDLDEYLEAKVIKVNPDSPQRPFREYALMDGKILIMATPRLRKGFILLDPKYLRGRERYASTIKGAFRYGRLTELENLPKIDLIVEGSVAASIDRGRIGKGEGYAELEYAILREMDLVDEDIIIVTSVHDIQVFKSLPKERHDVPIDIISTPRKIIECIGPLNRPKGIYWALINENMLDEIPLLKYLKKLRG